MDIYANLDHMIPDSIWSAFPEIRDQLQTIRSTERVALRQFERQQRMDYFNNAESVYKEKLFRTFVHHEFVPPAKGQKAFYYLYIDGNCLDDQYLKNVIVGNVFDKVTVEIPKKNGTATFVAEWDVDKCPQGLYANVMRFKVPADRSQNINLRILFHRHMQKGDMEQPSNARYDLSEALAAIMPHIPFQVLLSDIHQCLVLYIFKNGLNIQNDSRAFRLNDKLRAIVNVPEGRIPADRYHLEYKDLINTIKEHHLIPVAPLELNYSMTSKTKTELVNEVMGAFEAAKADSDTTGNKSNVRGNKNKDGSPRKHQLSYDKNYALWDLGAGYHINGGTGWSFKEPLKNNLSENMCLGAIFDIFVDVNDHFNSIVLEHVQTSSACYKEIMSTLNMESEWYNRCDHIARKICEQQEKIRVLEQKAANPNYVPPEYRGHFTGGASHMSAGLPYYNTITKERYGVNTSLGQVSQIQWLAAHNDVDSLLASRYKQSSKVPETPYIPNTGTVIKEPETKVEVKTRDGASSGTVQNTMAKAAQTLAKHVPDTTATGTTSIPSSDEVKKVKEEDQTPNAADATNADSSNTVANTSMDVDEERNKNDTVKEESKLTDIAGKTEEGVTATTTDTNAPAETKAPEEHYAASDFILPTPVDLNPLLGLRAKNANISSTTTALDELRRLPRSASVMRPVSFYDVGADSLFENKEWQAFKEKRQAVVESQLTGIQDSEDMDEG